MAFAAKRHADAKPEKIELAIEARREPSALFFERLVLVRLFVATHLILNGWLNSGA
jgi:hypothetical protein